MIIFADTYNHRLRVIDISSKSVSTLSGTDTNGHKDGACALS